MDNLLSQGGCSEYRYGCGKCLEAYKYWLCAVMLKECKATPMAVSGTIYGPDDFPGNYDYIMVKPCHSLCFHVQRMCPPLLQWKCSLKDSRDYRDWPYCNLLNYNAAQEM